MTRLRRWVPRWTLAVAIILVAGCLAWTAYDVESVRGLPREHGTLVSAVERRPPFTHSCGRGGGLPTDYTWQVQDAAPGLPATFTVRDSCDVRYDPGDTAVVVRSRTEAGGVKKVWFDPVVSYADGLWICVGVVLLWYLLYAGARTLRWAWFRYFWYDEPREGPAADSGTSSTG